MEDLVGKHVLVVEDEFLIAVMIEDILTDLGCVVVGPFSRVGDALQVARVAKIDIALLDVNVANEKVFPLAYMLEARQVPFMFLTGYGDMALPLDRPAWMACTKPFQPEQLVARLALMVNAG